MNIELLVQETDIKSFIILWIYETCAFWKFVRIFKLWIFKYDDNGISIKRGFVETPHVVIKAEWVKFNMSDIV